LSTPSSFGRAERLLQDPGLTPAEIFALIEDRLRSVEALFRESLSSPVGIVSEIGDFVAEAGGKRVRPTLHLLTARACRYDGPHDVLLGTVLEFIHSATLVHDDIIDEATTRRGRASLNYRWGNNITVLFGDYLFAKAMKLALGAGSLRVMETLADVTLRMIEGELLQVRYEGRIDLNEAEYLDLIERKTAALFSCCCELAGLLADVEPRRIEALRRYGLNLGMAFQIVDDLLDFTGDPATLGKPAAQDLREGKATLPVIDLLASGSDEAHERVRRVMAGGLEGPADEVEALKGLLQESGALDRALERAQQYASAAGVEIGCLPDTPARDALQTLPELLLFRDR
jgi:octaprenyl-diphosphate synthase